jgi:hypothetical protein
MALPIRTRAGVTTNLLQSSQHSSLGEAIGHGLLPKQTKTRQQMQQKLAIAYSPLSGSPARALTTAANRATSVYSTRIGRLSAIENSMM